MMTPKMTAKMAKRLKRIPIIWDKPQRMMMRPIMIPQIWLLMGTPKHIPLSGRRQLLP